MLNQYIAKTYHRCINKLLIKANKIFNCIGSLSKEINDGYDVGGSGKSFIKKKVFNICEESMHAKKLFPYREHLTHPAMFTSSQTKTKF